MFCPFRLLRQSPVEFPLPLFRSHASTAQGGGGAAPTSPDLIRGPFVDRAPRRATAGRRLETKLRWPTTARRDRRSQPRSSCSSPCSSTNGLSLKRPELPRPAPRGRSISSTAASSAAGRRRGHRAGIEGGAALESLRHPDLVHYDVAAGAGHLRRAGVTPDERCRSGSRWSRRSANATAAGRSNHAPRPDSLERRGRAGRADGTTPAPLPRPPVRRVRS